MKRKDIIIMIATFIFITIIISLSYAFFAANENTINNIIYTTTFEEGYSVVVETSARDHGPFSLSNSDMIWAGKDEKAAVANDIITLNITNNSDMAIYCTFDFVWEWESGAGLDNYVISSGATKEFVVRTEEHNSQVPNYNASDFTLNSSYTQAVLPNSNESFPYEVRTIFYNLADVDQSAHRNKKYNGHVKVDNVSCGPTFPYYLATSMPKSGIDAVSNSPWILTEDHPGEWRYAGKNPDNYIEFNGELWRIIGVMPNMEYCTGKFGYADECDTSKTGSLVKIIRNDSLGSLSVDVKQTGVGSSISDNGSNDWSDSQLMLMLNGRKYLTTGFDTNGGQLHQFYTITDNTSNNMVADSNGYDFYQLSGGFIYYSGTSVSVIKPSIATTSGYTPQSTTLPKSIGDGPSNYIATVRWDLYGTNSYTTTAQGTASVWYNKERNISNSGAVYTSASLPENRPVYWYGKIGLMYPSDYGYATGGGTSYDRNACLGKELYNWDTGNYKTSCAANSYLWYVNITSTAPGSTGATQRTITPNSGDSSQMFYVVSSGYVSPIYASGPLGIRPVLYLKPDTIFDGGTGTYDDPYTVMVIYRPD